MKENVGRPILDENDRLARDNAQKLAAAGLTGVNVLASPGAGKTSLILRMLEYLKSFGLAGAVIEGNAAPSIDSERVRSQGFPAVQVNTGGGCHLDAAMVSHALLELGVGHAVRGPGAVFIENIGNLICPAGHRLGEKITLVVASVPEGDDKPVKYPAAFTIADLVALNKVDLLESVEFNPDAFATGLRTVNESCKVFEVSCRTDQGIDSLADWLVRTIRI
ncbi:MAG: hydrogenase nickel incorporation protein HypB [Planctomycetes bacterium]|nr:hydrogenase nickel incorporation protein HypB [Planctomycetota bacterium]